MIDRKLLLSDLQKQVKNLEKDLREQAESVEEVRLKLRGEYDHAFKVGRTAATWAAWRDERVTQVAVAWVLGTVFVRFCEDNGLLPDPYLAGPGDRLVLAEEAEAQFFRDQPDKTLRDWLHQGFDAIASTQAGKSLFDKRHNPLYQIPLSHDEAKNLIAFWRRRGETGGLVHDFTDPEWDTRFLGDLYQDLSESARKTYALLQTPEFVEEFILDLTLTPAIAEFGHDVVKMIDPTCGSGHFVLGAFHRLLKEWEQHAPNRDPHERVRLALDAVHGVDINPFAVAIARFRLLVAALRVCNYKTLAETGGYGFPMHLAVGDSLIKARQLDLFGIVDGLTEFHYSAEDVHEHAGIIEDGRYHVVVGNPPYITVKDRQLNELYRRTYSSTAGRYPLSLPFAERFFQLAVQPGQGRSGSGYVGQITANSFMKREFGRALVEEFFATKVDLTHVIDSSGAYIPGHATPTVILVGRSCAPLATGQIRVVMGVRGEPVAPLVPEEGHVWQAIVKQIGQPGSESDWVGVYDLSRTVLSKYPWSLTGGGAAGVAEALEACSGRRLVDIIDGSIGFAGFSATDDVFYLPTAWHRRHGTPPHVVRGLIAGKDIGDWEAATDVAAIAPYDEGGAVLRIDFGAKWARSFWLARQQLRALRDFSGEERSAPWWSWYQWSSRRTQAPESICIAKIATHNRAFVNRQRFVTNQHVHVALLPAGWQAASVNGVLNSSAGCFWLKHVSQSKGNGGIGGGISDELWSIDTSSVVRSCRSFRCRRRTPSN